MKTSLFFALMALFISCSDSDDPVGPVSADRTKFIGTWAGSYSCPGGGSFPDTFSISTGSGTLDFSIIIHEGALNPDNVTGDLMEPDLIKVPEQSMGGALGTAEITFQDGLLHYSQSGFGITCGGTGYTLVP